MSDLEPGLRVQIAVGVILDRESGKVLLARRPGHVHQGGLWEFPGGKLQPGESRNEALDRELFEELGIRVRSAEPMMVIDHDYPDLAVRLDVWLIHDWEGHAHGREGQQIEWTSIAELTQRPFPPANEAIVKALLSA